MSHLSGLITVNIPPNLIVGNDTNVVYIENGVTKGDDNFTYLYGTNNPTVVIGGGTTTNPGTLRLGGSTGTGSIIANSIGITANNGFTLDTSGGPGNTLIKSLVTIEGASVVGTSTLTLASNNPVFQIYKPNNGASMKRWLQWLDGSGNLFTDTGDDVGNASQHAIQITRTGTTVTSHRHFVNGAIVFSVDANGCYSTGNVFGKTHSSALNPAVIAGPTNTGVTIMEATNYSDVAWYDATQPVNARSFDIINFQGKIQFRLKNDSGASTVNPIIFNGGFANYTGITTFTGPGSFQMTGQSSYDSPALLINMPLNPMIVFNAASGPDTNRKKWYMCGKNGNFFSIGISDDAGTNVFDGYQMYRGNGVIGGHQWYLGNAGNVGAPGQQSMSLSSNTFALANGVNMIMGDTSPDASAILQLKSTTKGFLPPQVTTAQMHAIPNPAQGLIVVNITTNQLAVRFGSAWYPITAGAPIAEE